MGCWVDDTPDFQIALTPVDVLRQSTSALPSPLKSPLPTICQVTLVTAVTGICVEATPDRHNASAPVVPLRHSTSDLPSPSKSPSAWCGCTTASTMQVLEQPSPLTRLWSSHCSRPSSTPLPHVAIGGVPSAPALLRGPGKPRTKSVALL